MTASDALLLTFGLVAGSCLGWLSAWRLARKLEAHGVVLAEWDQMFDAQAPHVGSKISGAQTVLSAPSRPSPHLTAGGGRGHG